MTEKITVSVGAVHTTPKADVYLPMPSQDGVQATVTVPVHTLGKDAMVYAPRLALEALALLQQGSQSQTLVGLWAQAPRNDIISAHSQTTTASAGGGAMLTFPITRFLAIDIHAGVLLSRAQNTLQREYVSHLANRSGVDSTQKATTTLDPYLGVSADVALGRIHLIPGLRASQPFAVKSTDGHWSSGTQSLASAPPDLTRTEFSASLAIGSEF